MSTTLPESATKTEVQDGRPRITPPTPLGSPEERARIDLRHGAEADRQRAEERTNYAATCVKNGNPEAGAEARLMGRFYAERAKIVESGLTVTAPVKKATP